MQLNWKWGVEGAMRGEVPQDPGPGLRQQLVSAMARWCYFNKKH